MFGFQRKRAMRRINFACAAGLTALLLANATMPVAAQTQDGDLIRNASRGVEYYEGRYREALQNSGESNEDTLAAMFDLARIYDFNGRYPEAEALFLRTLAGREALLGESHPDSVSVMVRLGQVYIVQERFSDARTILFRAEEISGRAFGAANAVTVSVQHELSILYQRIGQAEEAERYLSAAIAGSEQIRDPDDIQHLSLLSSRALRLLRNGRDQEALALFNAIHERLEATVGPNDHRTITVLANLAYLYRHVRDYETSLALTEEVMERRAETMGAAHPATLEAAVMVTLMRVNVPELGGDPMTSANLLYDGLGRRLAGSAESGPSDAQAGGFASAGTENADFLSVTGYAYFADAALVELSRSADQRPLADRGFQALQNAMASPASTPIARMAATRLADREAESLGNMTRERDALERRWRSASELYGYTFGGGDEQDIAERQSLRAEIDGIEARIAEIDEALRREFPDYFALINADAVSLEEARQMLGEDEAILMVVPTLQHTHLFVINRDGLSWQRSDWSSEQIEDAVRRLRWDLGATVTTTAEERERWTKDSDGRPAFDRTTSHRLYQQIIAPVADTLQDREHVFVIAGGALSGLPFSTLVTEAPEGDDSDPEALRQTRWFADAHALIQLPSVRSLQLLRRVDQAEGSDTNFAGFGDPELRGGAVTRGINRGGAIVAAADIFDGRRSRSGAALADVSALGSLARLPGTAVELENMRRALGAPASAIHLAGAATETAVRTADLSNVDILAFATHGLMAREMNDLVESGLVMTPPATASESDDGYLSASEVAALRLNADWVILSACNTAADAELGASGLSGLTRAFFHAGARNILASHWPVDDEVASRITVRTIELRQSDADLSRAQAFQQAMREIRNETAGDASGASWAHPAFWAPFTLFGDGAR